MEINHRFRSADANFAGVVTGGLGHALGRRGQLSSPRNVGGQAFKPPPKPRHFKTGLAPPQTHQTATPPAQSAVGIASIARGPLTSESTAATSAIHTSLSDEIGRQNHGAELIPPSRYQAQMGSSFKLLMVVNHQRWGKHPVKISSRYGAQRLAGEKKGGERG
ncbi:hypothetical protein HPP92_025099 [Vanilla planifolia]|uniref:Uncharacterized protein n=1 Tax=Vanilla planifolia TaxID=51239 RepID=A0A835PJZ3_VANPL|nr:hypothetical protein HPP92_025373 [Vanilla planifolia]KAG0453795.1 hypothetical protein HPP92_025099 [Vanilla planifolia]